MRKISNVSSSRGAPMGRSATLPDDRSASCKLHLRRLQWVDGDYDEGGAYWGHGEPIWWAYDDAGTIEMFTRARNRIRAKIEFLAVLPQAGFYR